MLKNLSKKAKWILAAVAVVIVILLIVGVKYLPIWSTIEAIVMLIVGGVTGWFLKSKKDAISPKEE